MDSKDDTTVQAERKRGQRLGPEERGAIKALKKQGFGAGAISRAIGCAPSTVTNELERGTPPRRSSKGKAPGYSPKRGEAVYKAHRVNSCKPRKDREKKKCYGTSISDRPEIAAIRIPGKTSKAVMDAMAALRAGYGQHFPQVFKTITVDNGSEFAGFAQAEHGTARFSLPTLIPHGSVPRTRGHPCSC